MLLILDDMDLGLSSRLIISGRGDNIDLILTYLMKKINLGRVSYLVLAGLPLKKLLSSFTTKSGCSSGIQCPEFGTITP
jgi:hypothetical protein